MHVLRAACHEQADTLVNRTLTLSLSGFCCSCIALLTLSSLIRIAAVSTACPHCEQHASAKCEQCSDCTLCSRILKQAADCCSVLSQVTAQKIGWLVPRVHPAAQLAASV